METIDFAHDCGIEILYVDAPQDIPGNVAWHPGHSPFIWLDSSLLDNSIGHKELLAEEIGHIFCSWGNAIPRTDALFNHRCTAWKVECRGRDWALKFLVPLWEIEAVMKEEINNIWDLSAYFEVSHKFMKSRLNLIDVAELRYELRA